MSERVRSGLLVFLLLAAGVWTATHIRVSGDLAKFMPVPADADEQLLLNEIGNGPGSRILLVAIGSELPASAASLSKALRVELLRSPLLEGVWNGEVDLPNELDRLLPLRFTHSPAMDAARFDAAGLAEVLRDRLADLGAVADPAHERLLAHDPHYLTLAMLDSWLPTQLPEERFGVWFSSRNEALLIIESKTSGFDLASQGAAVATIESAFGRIGDAGRDTLSITGPGSFSVRMNERISREAGILGAAAVAGFVALLFAAYRSVAFVVASALPLACAAAAGFVAVGLVFGEIHGITIAFAFTLIGVAQDYPIHLMSHARPGKPAREVVPELWPTLRLGVVSTILAYLTLFSGRSAGLAQLSVFTIAGLVTAAFVTSALLPALLPVPKRDVVDIRGFRDVAGRLRRARGGMAVVVPVLGLAAAVVWMGWSRPFWNNDLASLTPIPRDWLDEDSRLRSELPAPDVSRVVVLSGGDVDEVLRLSERVAPRFDDLRERDLLAHDGLPSRITPSFAVQSQRLARLPDADSLASALTEAADEVGFDRAFFDPMIADVAAAKSRARVPATEPDASALDDRLRSMFRITPDGVRAMVDLSGLASLEEARTAIEDLEGARLVDLKATAGQLVRAFRERVLLGLALAGFLIAGLLVLSLGWRGAARVVVPVALALVATVSIVWTLASELSVFHLVALILCSGLGVDYALFFQRSTPGRDESRTLHSVLVSAASTLFAFGLLSVSSVPLLQAIGMTVAVGVVLQFTLALLLARDS